MAEFRSSQFDYRGKVSWKTYAMYAAPKYFAVFTVASVAHFVVTKPTNAPEANFPFGGTVLYFLYKGCITDVLTLSTTIATWDLVSGISCE